MTKLYGITKILGFPCVCYGEKGYFFVIRWAKKHKRFKVYRGHTNARAVISNTINASRWWFVGIMVSTDNIEIID